MGNPPNVRNAPGETSNPKRDEEITRLNIMLRKMQNEITCLKRGEDQEFINPPHLMLPPCKEFVTGMKET